MTERPRAVLRRPLLVERDANGDAAEVARILMGQGQRVLLAGEGPEFDDIPTVVDIAGHHDAEMALLDVWTNETDERVLRLRQRGVVCSCLADWLLERSGSRMIGITGTAGKTTTATLLTQLLGAASSQARAANLWPTSQLLSAQEHERMVVELTSSHLAFCHNSPNIAAITNFWPDHLELHGGLEAYRAAKSRLFAWQQPGDFAVLPADDEIAASLAERSPASRVWFAEKRSSHEGVGWVWHEQSRILIDFPERQCSVALPAFLHDPLLRRACLCAIACALAVDQQVELEESLKSSLLPPFRRHQISSNPTVIDDTLAATPSKARAALVPKTRLVAGGALRIGDLAVNASELEKTALQLWAQAIRKNCISFHGFGEAGEWLAKLLRQEHLPTYITTHKTVTSALETALSAAEEGETVLVSPGFPMSQPERESVRASFARGRFPI